MATAIPPESNRTMSNGTHYGVDSRDDPFVAKNHTPQVAHAHRYSSNFDPDSIDLAYGASPSHAKRTLEAHLRETERRLQDTQNLGKSLLHQQTELSTKLKEVEQQKDEAEISPELRQRLVELEKEHNDVGKEIARALLPKSRAVSGEEKPLSEASTYSSQASASPTKVTAPSRRQRNQPTNRAGDLQFAADISTSLLAQVRQLQAAVAERDEIIKKSQVEHSRIEQDTVGISQKLRTLDENEQRYKDENWNLETQNHQLLAASRDAADREKRLNASLAAALAEKVKFQNDMDEIKHAHRKLTEEHTATKKAYDSELHGLKRTVDLGDTEKSSMQAKIDELAAQNQELAQAMAARFRGQGAAREPILDQDQDERLNDLSTPEGSPPPSPTKATPRHGGLESETMRSSLHHAHRMIQNLKNNIHREKTEKIELKRMLQDARDELEQRRTDGPGSGNKRLKTKSDTFKKPLRPDMLGGSRKSRTDVDVEDQDWEDHTVDSPSQQQGRRLLAIPGAFNERGVTDVSDAYQTSTETEGAFETADEKHGTESDDFQTGAESLAGDSTDDMTETEDNGGRVQRTNTVRGPPRTSMALKPAGDRTSFMSTASTSAEEDNDELQTPVQSQPHKFRLKNGRQSFAKQSRPAESTPESYRALSTVQDSPASAVDGRSPPAAEHSLYAELGEFDDGASDRFGTPGRASIASASSTPYTSITPSKRATSVFTPAAASKPPMVDAAMMTEPWQTQTSPITPVAGAAAIATAGGLGALALRPGSPPAPSPSDFPLPPSVPGSPIRKIDTSTQYTSQRGVQESPIRGITNFITPPKTVWDEAQDHESVPQSVHEAVTVTPRRQLDYSGMLVQDTTPLSPARTALQAESHVPLHGYSAIHTQQTEPISPPRSALIQPLEPSTDNTESKSRPRTAEKVATGAAAGGILATAAAALGFSKAKSEQGVAIAEDETCEPLRQTISDQAQMPLRERPDNNTARKAPFASKAEEDLAKAAPVLISGSGQGSQTTPTSEDMENAMRRRTSPILNIIPGALSAGAATSPLTSITPEATSVRQSRSQDNAVDVDGLPITPVKRPASSSSQRTSTLISQHHPPLPPDHRIAIAKAGGRVTSPSRELSSSAQVPGLMGPPTMSASAMRRPRTPAEATVRTATRDSTATRASFAPSYSARHQRAGTTSQLSKRSSVSSFASELDERFNIRPDAPSASHGFEASPGTDPRMIQAITQTMIGEFLWKYTRKAGRSEMSDTRHKRYFWVHPYTKTLYWSDQDPQTAGRTELKAKSVAIQSVRVVADDNPMPPGLHRKSLEVTTPGRKVKFTAATGQRHETWFNALSYLLLRGDDPFNHTTGGSYAPGGSEITRDDIEEFDVGGNGYGARLAPSGSRISMSSYNSRTTRGTSTNRASIRQSQALPPGVIATSTTSRLYPADSVASRTMANTTVRRSRAEQPREADKDRTLRTGSVSRISRMIGSVTGRTRREELSGSQGIIHSESGSIYDASIVSDNGRRNSGEEMRREMLRQEREGLGNGGGLENVRACCDGKHDVSTLHHSHSHSTSRGISRQSSVLGQGSRGMSLRGSMSRKNTGGPSS